jgi:hypothetical protein
VSDAKQFVSLFCCTGFGDASCKENKTGTALPMKNKANQKRAVQNGSSKVPSCPLCGGMQVKPGGYKLHGARQYIGGLSVPTMHRLIQRGLLHPNRALRHLLFSREELDRFLKDGMA